MSYVIYDKSTTVLVGTSLDPKIFRTERGAKGYLTRLVNRGFCFKRENYAITDMVTFHTQIETWVTKKNLLSGKEFRQPLNTPICCDPSSETYWSM